MILCAVTGSLTASVVPATPQTVQSVAAAAGQSVCIVLAEGGSGTTSGTGFVVADRFILTAHHVVQNASHLRVLCPDHPSTEVQLVKVDADNDLALLYNTLLSIPPLPLGEPAKVQVGQEIVVIGFPRADLLGAETATVTQGIVSSVGAGALQIQAPVGPGNSGSPVLTLQGQVIGLVRAVLGSQLGTNYATSFATGIDAAKPFLTSALKGPYGGVAVGNAPPVWQAPKPAGSSSFVITPGRSIGDLKLGMNRDEMEHLLGPAKKVFRRRDGGYSINWYDQIAQSDNWRGFFAVLSASSEVVIIGVLNDQRYVLTNGLRHGSTERDVRAVLGEPSRTSYDGSRGWEAETDPNNKLLYYDSLGLRLAIVSNRSWGMYGLVHELAVYRPR